MNGMPVPEWPTEEERAMLRASFMRLIPHSEEVSERVYTRLFSDHPSLRRLFPSDLYSQQEKLVSMLASAVDALEDPEAFVATCRDLGRRHVDYGAEPGHYPVVGTLLLEELGAALNPPITAQELELWNKLYNLVAIEMLKGAGQTTP
jgi:hemoglobin-like flavoprotein